jgi:hypothetical protein
MSRAPPSERELGHEQIETSIFVKLRVGVRAKVHAVPVLSSVCPIERVMIEALFKRV